MFKYIGLTILGAFIIYPFAFPRRVICTIGRDWKTIAKVTCGQFKEYIPQTGSIDLDSMSGLQAVVVPIDELYVEKICEGLKATTTFDNNDYHLLINAVDPEIKNGRFTAKMKFVDAILPRIPIHQHLRLRIELSDVSDQILLPVGGFYKDTGGSWILVVGDNGRALRRNIKLGRKMGSEYFEVLEGLNPGDQVVTSSYESLVSYCFNGIDSVALSRLDAQYYPPYSIKRFRQDMFSFYSNL